MGAEPEAAAEGAGLRRENTERLSRQLGQGRPAAAPPRPVSIAFESRYLRRQLGTQGGQFEIDGVAEIIKDLSGVVCIKEVGMNDVRDTHHRSV